MHIKFKHKNPKERYQVEELDVNKTLLSKLTLNTVQRFKLGRLFQHSASSGTPKTRC